MSFTKHWHGGEKEMIRTKPYIGANNALDELAESEAEWQRTNHEAGECRNDCPHCEAEHYQRHVFDRFQTIFKKEFDR